MLQIEISYTTDENEEFEHWGYYDNIEDAKKGLEDIKRMVEEDQN